MQPKKEHKRKYAITVGAIFIILAIIGIITVATYSFRITANLLDNQRQKTNFETILTPIVMFDPATFETPSDIDNQRLLLYSMWTTLSSEKADHYSRSEENNTLLVPASDIEASAYKLFRDKVKIEHETFSDIETVYFYDEENNTYEVPTYGFLYVYLPKVTDITKQDEAYDIAVEYIPPDNAWNSIYKGDGKVFSSKKMMFTMEKVDGAWYVLSMRDPSDKEGIYQGTVKPNVYDAELGSSGDGDKETDQG